MKQKIGYKLTNNMKCESLTYEVGKTYEIDSIKVCNYGFHYCPKIKDVLKYKEIDKSSILIEVEDLGNNSIVEEDKVCTNKIKVLRVVPQDEHKLFTIENEKLVYQKDFDGEYFYKYDDKGNLIYQKDFDGEYFYKYDDKGNLIYKKYPNGNEYFYKYDDKGNLIYKKYPKGDEYFWEYKYDNKGNLIYKKDPKGDEYFYKYDDKGNLIYYKEPETGAWNIKIK